MDVVRTDSGYISGTVLGDPDRPVHVYRGIPYAAPPIGDLRWKPPQPVAPWSGIRECTALSKVAPQPSWPMISNLPQSEDCLYINVLTPAKGVSDRLPVMVWLHGGGFGAGSGNERGYKGTRLPLKGIVLVDVNMRLGALGCLAHPLLSRESSNAVSGNYLLLDIVAALRWVQKNICVFGGDPDKVTIFGQSGGGGKVISLMASPLAEGLFHRAIAESGVRGWGTPLKEAEALGERLFVQLGVDRERDPLASARSLPWQKIIEADLAESRMLFGPWDTVIDGWFSLDTPTNVFKVVKQHAVPLIMGINQGETTSPGPIPQQIPFYSNYLSGTNKAGRKGYAYIFDHVPANWKKVNASCIHAMELPYIFGSYGENDSWRILLNNAIPNGTMWTDPDITEVDSKVSNMMMDLWTNFAKTGDPSIPGVIDWPAWDESGDQYLYITEKPEVRSGFSKIAQK